MKRKKIVVAVAILFVLLPVSAQRPGLTADEQEFVNRIYRLQESDDVEGFYKAEDEYMAYLEAQKDWQTFYNVWMNKAAFDINRGHYYRAYMEIRRMTDDIQSRGKREFGYMPKRMMGLYHQSKGNYEMSERYLRRALAEVDTMGNALATFNIQIVRAQALSHINPGQALALLDSLPPTYKDDIAALSAVLSYYCIFSYRKGDAAAFRQYYAQYTHLRGQNPEQFNSMNYNDVMVYRHLIAKEFPQALAWCDSIRDPVESAGLRVLAYQQMGAWQKAYQELTRKDSIIQKRNQQLLNEELNDLVRDIAAREKEQTMADEAKKRTVSIVLSVCLVLALALAASLNHQRKKARKKNLALGNFINELLDYVDQKPKQPGAPAPISMPTHSPDDPALASSSEQSDELAQLFLEIDRQIRDEQLYTNINLQRRDVLVRFGISRAKLSLLLNTYADGQSFPVYLNAIRMEKACILLRNAPGKTISSIAEEVGLTEHNIYRLFQQYFGQTPLQYRQSHRKD